jgi:arsenate reductase-like glutaredoxin family protein
MNTIVKRLFINEEDETESLLNIFKEKGVVGEILSYKHELEIKDEIKKLLSNIEDEVGEMVNHIYGMYENTYSLEDKQLFLEHIDTIENNYRKLYKKDYLLEKIRYYAIGSDYTEFEALNFDIEYTDVIEMNFTFCKNEFLQYQTEIYELINKIECDYNFLDDNGKFFQSIFSINKENSRGNIRIFMYI